MDTISVMFSVQNGLVGNHSVTVDLDEDDIDEGARETEIIDTAFNKALNSGLISVDIL